MLAPLFSTKPSTCHETSASAESGFYLACHLALCLSRPHKDALFQDALSRIDTTRLSGLGFTLIRFLPSASGGEFLSSIYGYYTEDTPDGWPPGGTVNLAPKKQHCR